MPAVLRKIVIAHHSAPVRKIRMMLIDTVNLTASQSCAAHHSAPVRKVRMMFIDIVNVTASQSSTAHRSAPVRKVRMLSMDSERQRQATVQHCSASAASASAAASGLRCTKRSARSTMRSRA